MPIVIIVLLIVLIVQTNRLGKARKWDGQEEGYRAVRITLAEDIDADLINYLDKIDNKSAFFKQAARDFIEAQERIERVFKKTKDSKE